MIDYYNDIFPIFQGMMCMMLVYIGLQNYFIPDKAYRFYFFHILCWLLYFTLRSELIYDWRNNPEHLFGVNFIWNFHRVGFPMLSYLLYYSFTNRLLDLPNTLPQLSQNFKIMQLILVAYLVLLIVAALFFPVVHSQTWYEIVHIIVRLFVAGFSIYMMVLLYRSVDKLRWFFVVGSIFLLIFALFAMLYSIIYVENLALDKLVFWQYPMFNMQLGVILEIVCLSLALSYKAKVKIRNLRLNRVCKMSVNNVKLIN
jgi:7TM diverse intracellular signalling